MPGCEGVGSGGPGDPAQRGDSLHETTRLHNVHGSRHARKRSLYLAQAQQRQPLPVCEGDAPAVQRDDAYLPRCRLKSKAVSKQTRMKQRGCLHSWQTVMRERLEVRATHFEACMALSVELWAKVALPQKSPA